MRDFWRVFDGSVEYRDDGLWGRSPRALRVAVGRLVLAVGFGANLFAISVLGYGVLTGGTDRHWLGGLPLWAISGLAAVVFFLALCLYQWISRGGTVRSRATDARRRLQDPEIRKRAGDHAARTTGLALLLRWFSDR